MKKCLYIAVAGAFLVSGHSAIAGTSAQVLKSEKQKFSYAIGMDAARTLKRMGADIDMDAFKAGVATIVKDKTPQMTQKEAEEVKHAVFSVQQKKRAASQKLEGDKNMKAGKTFLADNAKKKGVKITKSGLQYQVIKKGNGKKPAATDKVKVNYRGTLLDGTEFDSSYKRGEPVTFPLNRVIKGWTEGVQLMPVGSKYKFFVPSALAYGERGAGAKIGSNTTLIFEVELISIEK